MENKKETFVWALLRLSMGWMLLWAFVDKLFGFGFATKVEKAWLAGGSPTMGFLKFGTKGPFAHLYQSLAGNPVIDWIFMLGLVLIGLALILGVGIKIASYSGALMMVLIYTAGSILPENNPFLDEHIIYILIFLGLAMTDSGDILGLGKRWSNTKLVQKYPILR